MRFVQPYAGGARNDDNRDAHGDLFKNHSHHAGRADNAIARLLKDLKRRSLLEETLVTRGGELGRQPTAENASGTSRDHNAYGSSPCRSPAAELKGASASARLMNTARPPSSIGPTSRTCTPPPCTCLASIPTASPSITYNGLDQKLVGVEGAEPIHQITA